MNNVVGTRVKGGDRRDGWYIITPLEAQEALDHRNPKNRPLSELSAGHYASDLKGGHWKKNGETLIFDSQARLLDGQTRLRACVLADKPIESYCVYSVNPNAFDTMDTGKGRGPSDVAAILNIKNYSTCASIAALILRTSGDTPPLSNIKVKNLTLRRWLEKNKQEVELAGAAVTRVQEHFKGIIGVSRVGWVYFYARRQNIKKANQFLEGFSTGENLQKGNPILALRSKLFASPARKASPATQLKPKAKLVYVAKAWVAFRDGVSVKVLSLQEDEVVHMGDMD